MREFQRVGFIFLIFGLLFSNASCTRSMDQQKLSVDFSSLSGLTGLNLRNAFITVYLPDGRTFSQKYEYEAGEGIAIGGSLEFVFNNVPQVAGTTVQFLGVFEDATGVMTLSYGAAAVSNNTANILATSAGTVTSQGIVSGRLLASTMKTGRMTAFYVPAGGQPMPVDTSDIINGWFNIMALEGSANGLTYKLDDGTTVFDNVYMSSGSLYIAGSSVSPYGSHILKVNFPTTYKQEYSNGVPLLTPKARPATSMYYGYFNGGTAPSTEKVCYPNFDESVIGVYGDANLSNYVKFKGPSASAGQIGIGVSSGVAENIDGYYISTGNCSKASGSNLYFFPQMAQQDIERASMVRPPFAPVQPQVMGNEWLKTTTTVSGGNTTYNFAWAFLIGISTPHISGVDILKINGSFSGGGDENCDALQASGYTLASNLTSFPTSGTVTVPTGAWNFAICPYVNVGGIKTYYKNFLRSGCVGQCNPLHYGWSASGAVTIGTTETFSDSGGVNFKGVSQRVTGVTVASDYTSIAVGSEAGFAAGDEVMFSVSGASSNSACGTGIDAGATGFARVLSVTTGNVKVAPGSFMDSISTTNIGASSGSSPFCYVQVQRVPHFTDLTINGSGQVTTGAFDYAANGKGIIAFRVNGTFTNAGQIDASLAGYMGGSSSITVNGGGPRSANYSTTFTSSYGGGEGGSAGGGGSGAEPSSIGGMVSGSGGVNTQSYGYINTLFGSGGGKGSTAEAGQYGGGSIFISAKKLVSNNGFFMANGGASANFGGGGGGGSITLVAKYAENNGMNISVQGGSSTSGGGGGGGSARAYFCNRSGTAITSGNFSMNAGNGGTGATAPMSFANAFPSTANGSNYYFCNQ